MFLVSGSPFVVGCFLHLVLVSTIINGNQFKVKHFFKLLSVYFLLTEWSEIIYNDERKVVWNDCI